MLALELDYIWDDVDGHTRYSFLFICTHTYTACWLRWTKLRHGSLAPMSWKGPSLLRPGYLGIQGAR